MPRPQTHLAKVKKSSTTPLFSGEVSELIAEVLQAREAAKPPRRELHVSDLGRCPRQIALRLTGVVKSNPPTIDSLINFAVGEAVEDKIASLLADNPKVLAIHRNLEFKIFFNGFTIEGHADILIELTDSHILVECKSINSRAMSWMLKKGDNGKDDHRLQNAGYLYGSHFVGSPIKPHQDGKIVYIVKDATKGEPVMFEASFTMESEMPNIETELTILTDTARGVERGVIPEIPEGYKFSAYPCTYCDWQRHCHGYEAAPNDEPPTTPEEEITTWETPQTI